MKTTPDTFYYYMSKEDINSTENSKYFLNE